MKWSIAACIALIGAVAVQADDASSNVHVKQPALRSELLRRAEIDQAVRIGITDWLSKNASNGALGIDTSRADQKEQFDRLSSEMKKVDRDNSDWLKNLVDNHGWPTVTLVGKDGARAAWLLIQHADAAPQFQRKCLDLMVKLPSGEVSQKNVAYLTDRVLLAEGKKQLFGTQFSQVEGKLLPQPIEDEANMDQRRAEVGLPPLAEYAEQLDEVYGGSGKLTNSGTNAAK